MRQPLLFVNSKTDDFGVSGLQGPRVPSSCLPHPKADLPRGTLRSIEKQSGVDLTG